MTVRLLPRALAAPIPAVLWLLVAASGAAQERPADGGVAPAPAVPAAPELPRYHHTVLSWGHSVSTQTVGVGDDVQSDDPHYNMELVAKTRYYFIDDTPRGEHLSVRADGGITTELTNSDTTTRRGEWSFVDTDLALVYARRFLGPADTDGTLAEVRPLTLTLPTSKASMNSGRYFAAGALLGITQVTPILPGRVKPDISSSVRLAAQYQRWFARATVPTNSDLERVRLTPDGRTLPGDQLAGSSLIRDSLSFTARLRLAFGEAVLWTTDFGVQPAWKYNVDDSVQVCGVVATGCADVRVGDDDNRHVVLTQITSELSFRIVKSLSFEVGYGNATSQLGADGRRRGFFYSPDAIFFASLSFTPHELASTESRTAALPLGPRL